MEELITDDIVKEKIDLLDVFNQLREYIYPCLFYACGLVMGTILYPNINSKLLYKAMSALSGNQTEFVPMFINRFCLYFSIFVLTVLLGLCLIGFPFTNLIPMSTGLAVALKLSYYYVQYNVKGIGYGLLMIVPEFAAFITVIVFTIKVSNELSKSIYDAATKKEDVTEEVNLKSHLKAFLIYGGVIICISLVNAGASYLLQSIVTI